MCYKQYMNNGFLCFLHEYIYLFYSFAERNKLSNVMLMLWKVILTEYNSQPILCSKKMSFYVISLPYNVHFCHLWH